MMELDEDWFWVIIGYEFVVYDWCVCLNRLLLLIFVGLWFCCIVVFYIVVLFKCFVVDGLFCCVLFVIICNYVVVLGCCFIE